MPTTTINIADRGTSLSSRTTSTADHMWFDLNNGSGNKSGNFEERTMARETFLRQPSSRR